MFRPKELSLESDIPTRIDVLKERVSTLKKIERVAIIIENIILLVPFYAARVEIIPKLFNLLSEPDLLHRVELDLQD